MGWKRAPDETAVCTPKFAVFRILGPDHVARSSEAGYANGTVFLGKNPELGPTWFQVFKGLKETSCRVASNRPADFCFRSQCARMSS